MPTMVSHLRVTTATQATWHTKKSWLQLRRNSSLCMLRIVVFMLLLSHCSGILTQRTEGCNHIACAQCHADWVSSSEVPQCD